jgi:hypothetical protein
VLGVLLLSGHEVTRRLSRTLRARPLPRASARDVSEGELAESQTHR